MILGLLIWSIFAWITWISSSFRYEIPNAERPILLVTTLWILSAILSLTALWLALKMTKPNRDFVIFTFLFSVAFRLIQLFSEPFQEIDNYRYMWDGIVLSKGHTPYRYSPYQVMYEPAAAEEQQQLRNIAFRHPAAETIISRVHFPEVRTVYPPTSQVVFGCTMALVPDNASVMTHVLAIKSAIVLFDLGILFLLAYLLSLMKMNILWAMAYGWNPLIIKEFANSGHLDSIAVFFCLLSVVWVIKAFSKSQNTNVGKMLFLAGLALALGLAAKIFPVILAPLVIFWIIRNHGWKNGALFGGSFSVFAILFMLPMILEAGNRVADDESATTNQEGLSTFLRRWEINELPYMLVHQNLKAIAPDQETNRPWFRILNESLRKSILSPVAAWVGTQDAPYYASRLITIGIFGMFYAGFLWTIWKQQKEHERTLLSLCFAVIAVFFCLQPTQNPWYWTWAIPFLPFTRNRAWLGYSVFLFVYYSRFWFSQLEGTYHFAGHEYSGTGLFDFVIVWLEHLPVLLAVGVHYLCSSIAQSKALEKG